MSFIDRCYLFGVSNISASSVYDVHHASVLQMTQKVQVEWNGTIKLGYGQSINDVRPAEKSGLLLVAFSPFSSVIIIIIIITSLKIINVTCVCVGEHDLFQFTSS